MLFLKIFPEFFFGKVENSKKMMENSDERIREWCSVVLNLSIIF